MQHSTFLTSFAEHDAPICAEMRGSVQKCAELRGIAQKVTRHFSRLPTFASSSGRQAIENIIN